MNMLGLICPVLPALGLLALATSAMSGEIVKVHTEWPEANRTVLAAAAGNAIPGLEIEWVEPDKADMLWGVPVRILMGLDRADLLEPYTPADAPLLRPSFRSADLPMRWTGLTAKAPAICYNTLIGNSSFAMPEPHNWETLAGTEFNLSYEMGPQLQLTDLGSAPVGTELVNGWIAAMGPTAAMRFLKALQPKVAAVQLDAVETCRKVALGYSAVGIGVTADAIRLAGEGAPLKIIVPNPVAYDMNGSALRRGAGSSARKLADFAVSTEAMEIYAATTLIVSRPGTPGTIQNVPPARSKDLESIDFAGYAPFSTTLFKAWRAQEK